MIPDAQGPIPHRVEGKESMGNGTTGTSGRAAILLNAPLPQRTLTVQDLFSGETVVFPLADLDQQTRRNLEPCFSREPR